MREDVHRLKSEATRLKSDAEAQFNTDQSACYQKFLAAHCIDAARDKKRKALDEAKALELKARSEERDAKSLERELRQARKAEEAPRKEREERERQARYREEQAK